MQLFNDDHHQFRETVRKFVAGEITPHAAEWEKNGAIPKDLWRKMGELGFLGFCYDEIYGGLNLDAAYSVVLAEELTRSRCGGVEVAVSVHNDMSTTYVDLLGTNHQKTRFLTPCIKGEAVCAIAVTEPDAGTDVAAIRTTAIRDGNEYIINGQKTFISNGHSADIIIVAAKTDPKSMEAYKGISLLVVEKGAKGFTAGRKLEKMGSHACDTAELFFEDCRVPAENLLGEPGSGFKAIMQNFQKERLIAAVMSTAYCEQMISDTIQYVKERKVFGRPVGSFQVNKHKLVEMASETEMAKVFVYHCCQGFIAGRDMIKEISMAKYLAGELVNRVAYQCVQLHGGYGYMQEYPICKAYTNVRLHAIAGGTTEIMKEVIASKIGL